MTNFIPIFPINIVVFPGEKLNMHIFEARYKQLINDCVDQKKSFGIISATDGKLRDFGTLINVEEISKRYDDGKLDIKTKATKVFVVLEIIKELPDKFYGGAIVNYPNNLEQINAKLMSKILKDVRHLHKLLNVTKDFKKQDETLCSYDIAHHVGLSVNEEYEMLELLHENQRLEYIRRHIAKTIEVVTGVENLKDKIKLNGHFRELEGFDF
jgi:Lon protease-like protein